MTPMDMRAPAPLHGTREYVLEPGQARSSVSLDLALLHSLVFLYVESLPTRTPL